MKKFIVPVFTVLFLFSCSKKNETVVTSSTDSSGIFLDEESVADSALAASTSCFMEVTGQDTLFAQIDDNLGTVTGKLFYKNYQKDSSFGDLLGSSNGDTIKVDYTFESEGMLSTREIWFLKQGGKLYEGIGSYDKSGEKYADYKKIKFEEGHILEATDCKTIANKFPEISIPEPAAIAPKPVEKVVKTEITPNKTAETSQPKTETKTVEKKNENTKKEVKKSTAKEEVKKK